MKKLLFLSLISTSLLLVWCFWTEVKPVINNQITENKPISQIQTWSIETNTWIVEQVSQSWVISNSWIEKNTWNIKNELDLCELSNYWTNDFEFSKDNLWNKLFWYKNYKNWWMLMSKPIDYNDNKYFTLNYYAFENVKWWEQSEKIEIYNMNCNKSISKVIYTDKWWLYRWFKLLWIFWNKIYIYEYVWDWVWSAFWENYILDINTKKYEKLFDYINAYNGSESTETKTKSWEWGVIFNKDFTKAIKIQDLNDVVSFWKIDWLLIQKKSYILVTDILTKKTSVIDDGINDYSYMNYIYQDFIKWADNNTIEITLKDNSKKNIIVN